MDGITRTLLHISVNENLSHMVYGTTFPSLTAPRPLEMGIWNFAHNSEDRAKISAGNIVRYDALALRLAPRGTGLLVFVYANAVSLEGKFLPDSWEIILSLRSTMYIIPVTS